MTSDTSIPSGRRAANYHVQAVREGSPRAALWLADVPLTWISLQPIREPLLGWGGLWRHGWPQRSTASSGSDHVSCHHRYRYLRWTEPVCTGAGPDVTPPSPQCRCWRRWAGPRAATPSSKASPTVCCSWGTTWGRTRNTWTSARTCCTSAGSHAPSPGATWH